MADEFTSLTKEISRSVGEIRKAMPALMDGFSTLATEATRDDVLEKKTKELIALAIAVATHCDGCIGFHTRTLVKLGATREEVLETLGVTIYMGGGPSLMYAADAVRAFDEFSAARGEGRREA
jgi:AhpD family alkylhydroperoxidase